MHCIVDALFRCLRHDVDWLNRVFDQCPLRLSTTCGTTARVLRQANPQAIC